MPEPARFTIHLTAVVDGGQDGMSAVWDRIDAALDAIPGVFGEGGSAALMKAEDVVAGSPLDEALRVAEHVTTGGPDAER